MHPAAFTRLFYFVRALSLFCVMAALLFSCGEGIRLFPFPVQVSDQNTALGYSGGERIQYEENAPRIERSRENDENGDRSVGRDQHNAYIAGSGITFSGAASVTDTATDVTFRSVFDSLQIASRLHGRAPPRS